MSTTDEDPAYEIDMEGETEYSFQPRDPEPHPSSATSLADGHPNVQPTLMVRNTFLELVEDEDIGGSKLRKRRMSAPVSSVCCTDRKSQEQGMAELQDRWRMSSRHTESTCSLDGRLGSMSTTDENPAYEIDMEGETEYSFQPGDPEPHPSSATSLVDGHPNVQPTLPAYSLEPLPMLRNEPEVSMAKGSLVMVSVPFVPV